MSKSKHRSSSDKATRLSGRSLATIDLFNDYETLHEEIPGNHGNGDYDWVSPSSTNSLDGLRRVLVVNKGNSRVMHLAGDRKPPNLQSISTTH
jgi:hypothetical protein